MDLTLYGAVASRTLRVLWMLEELDLPFTHVPAAPHAAEVRALGAGGKVPVLVVDGTVLTDSVAILTWLADMTGRLTCPAGTLDRARQDAFTQLILDEIEAPLWATSRHSFILPPERRVPQIKESARWDYAQACDRLAERLDGPFLMGTAMTVPDIVLTHCLGWGIAAKFPVSDGLQDYFDAMRDRPAYQAARARANA